MVCSARSSVGQSQLSEKILRPLGSVRRQMSPGQRLAFTLIELLVVIAILSLLVSILIPSLNRAKFLAKNVICQSNLHQIGLALVTYTADFRDVITPVSESPYKGIYNGDRQTPRILADAGLLPISDERGGVWRCPLDERDYRPRFLAYYYYREGGPGREPTGLSFEDLYSCSYGTNGVYRYWSPRSPWSYWGSGGEWFPRHYSHAATPTNTVWVLDTHGWSYNSNTPYQMFYTWQTLEWWDGSHPEWLGHRRHNPESYGPCSTLMFMDAHVQQSIDLLETCTDDDYNYDTALALEWWSFTGE